jgi:hypothetical protein
MHYPVHPLLDPRTRATLAAELAQASRNPKLCPLMERAPDLWPGLVRSYLHLARLPRKLRRQLQRRWKRSLAGLALLLALGQAPALAATIDVTPPTPTSSPAAAAPSSRPSTTPTTPPVAASTPIARRAIPPGPTPSTSPGRWAPTP